VPESAGNANLYPNRLLLRVAVTSIFS